MAFTLALLLGGMAGAGVTAKLRAPTPPARIYQAPECQPAMSHPLDWTISVAQSGDGKAPVTRYYKARP